jgi:isoleucyl-tRNA synthetase
MNHCGVARNPDLGWPADMYLEGSDQHRGWFQSSLLVALATRGRPPFREVLTHGFLIDLEGRKMSKSLGNTIVPQEVIKESGAEIIRLWVSMTEFTEELRVSREILTRVIDVYRKIRNTCRILVANLYDFNPAVDLLPVADLTAVDRFALARYAEAAQRMLRAYDEYDFSTVSQTFNTLATVDLSAFYVDVTKDRMYTLGITSHERRSTQTAMYLICDGLARLLAPILPVTADDLWRRMPGDRESSVHLADFPRVEAYMDPALVKEWTRLLEVRERVNAALEQKRKDKVIGTALSARVQLAASGSIAALLHAHRDELPMLFNVSEVSLSDAGEGDDVRVTVERARGVKCARCWRFVPSVRTEPEWEGICDRCVDALGGTAAA